MTRARRWMAGTAVAVLLLVAGAWLAVRMLLPTDEELAADLGARFERASGIGLKVGRAQWSLRPSPVIVLSDIATAQPQPITVKRIVVRPQLSILWKRRIAIDLVEVEGAVLPRESVRAFRGRWKANDPMGAVGGAMLLAEIPVERVRLRDITWFDRRDIGLAYDADVVFEHAWRPREAEVARTGVTPPARLRIERDGNQDRWRTLIDAGGGTWNGMSELHIGDGGRLRLTAQLEPRDIDIAALVRTFERRSAIDGKFHGQTEIDTEGDNATELVRHLHTRTRFTVQPATLKGFDLLKAVRSGGADRSGNTSLDEMSGTLDTEATDDGVRLRYSGLRARSGVLTASGNATVYNRTLRGDAAIDLVDGVVGVPFKLAGTLDKPEFSLTGGALTGAAIGSVILPGVGTALGARVGQKIEQMFGGNRDDDAKPKPRAPAPKPRP